ncbi:hypothetical protein AOX59_06485 [Lentibacillus amyloliquefaciens]|uniref:Uncharacterized protein n=1 Tax=Lentibacillus amyloliquefaciens TaxID=1472767 RepID=A0A0U4E4W5_9BACI|nr:hypothetical protein AOX59_06485 [Lentibacillus amyloliquefaciens]
MIKGNTLQILKDAADVSEIFSHCNTSLVTCLEEWGIQNTFFVDLYIIEFPILVNGLELMLM